MANDKSRDDENQNEKNLRSGQQGTLAPEKRPGQTSQDPSLDPPKKPDTVRTGKKPAGA
jgi:hypothetical protein